MQMQSSGVMSPSSAGNASSNGHGNGYGSGYDNGSDESGGLNLPALWSAARRRAKPMGIVAGVIALIAVLAAALWPPTYRSTGTILIEQQEIPKDVIRSAVTSYADQRVQVISQRVMTSTNLLSIIEKYDLYPGKREKMTRETLIDRMRDDIRLQMVSADVVDPTMGRATKATIAFQVSYESANPQTAARVANELTSLYLSENITSRKQLAADTAGFLQSESVRLGKRVTELEQQIATFKEQNAERLPEYTQFNAQLADRSQQELRDLDARVRGLDQQIVFLDAQLAQLNPSGLVYTENGERVLSKSDRLKMARSQYASAVATYTPDHPDVLRLKREVESLEAQVSSEGGLADSSNDISRKLTAARGELEAAQKNLSPDHPDVQRLAREVASLEASAQEAAARNLPAQSNTAAADNPAYISIRAQRSAAQNERAALQVQMGQVRARVADIEKRQALAPAVERDYNALLREMKSEQEKYAEVRQKEMEAQLVSNLETERKGERFTLIEPPVQPEKPISPNRAAILLLGALLALGAAVALMYLLETLDTRVRDREHVLQLVGVPPLAVIPYMELPEERASRVRFQRRAMVASAASVLVVMVFTHLFVRPLDLLWLAAWRRFGGG
jgi:uncharacterized protein involved in exopolysaccharide biosynthesis